MAKDREECLRKGVKSELNLLTQVDVDKHYQSIRNIIDDYHKSNRRIKDPMVVLFTQSKQYSIMPNEELTPALWLERPYITYGAID